MPGRCRPIGGGRHFMALPDPWSSGNPSAIALQKNTDVLPVMSASVMLAEALRTLNSMALTLNVYPLALKYVENGRISVCSPRFLAYDIMLFIVHGILLIQATLTLVLKITHRSKSGELWLWRKQYLLDQTIPYLIPNGQFIIEPLQILGCIFFQLLTAMLYIGVRWPDTVRKAPAFHETSLFWLALSFAPGFIGFWWSGWSSFYALRVVMTLNSSFSRMYQSPMLINTLCIGVPVLISLFFITIGASLAASHRQMEEAYATFLLQLRHLSEVWKPNDPNTVKNNRHLYDTLQSLLAGASEILHRLELMAIGWAITAMTIIIFYIGTAISVGKVTRRTLKMATGRATFLTYAAKDAKPDGELPTSRYDDELELKAQSNHPQDSQVSQPSGIMKKKLFYLHLATISDLLRTSCGLMVISLGFNFCISIIFVIKARLIFIE
ncbi:hypothetical protein VP01_3574g1 [Puccinia sorghi]|uniref:Transmembrane protein n=1 Tax=Puccinia sorghi TaxID=27349 RepID=A0A0L6UX71_9BASI|nr:hypothetical protein VP01_3574g1 [Puccinia sorghi]